MESNSNNPNTNYPTFQESQIEQSDPLGAYAGSPALTLVRSTKNLPSRTLTPNLRTLNSK